MTGFLALLKLQLLSRFADLKPRNFIRRLQEKKGRTIGKTLLYVFLVLYLGGMLFYLENKMLDVLIQLRMPDLIVSLAILVSMVGTLIMSFFFVMSSLYLNRDGVFMASLPLRQRTVLGARLCQIWISETGIAALLLWPVCILYGVRTGQNALFYLRLIPVWLGVSVLPICMIALISSLLIRVTALWKHREMAATVGGIVFIVAYMLLAMNIGSMTGDSASGGDAFVQFVTSNRQRISMLTHSFPPAGWAAGGLLGNLGELGLFVLVNLLAAALTFWLLGLNYRKLSLLQAETPAAAGKRVKGETAYRQRSVFAACAWRELKTILRVPAYATNILPIAFMPLLMVIMMSIIAGNAMNQEAGETLQMVFDQLNPAIPMAIMAAVLSYMAGMNPAMATAVSREGKGHDFLVGLPIRGRTLIWAKLAVGFGMTLLGVACAAVALCVLFPGQWMQTVLAFLLCAVFSYVGAVISLAKDVRRPRLDWVTEQEAVKQNFGLLTSMLITWGILLSLGVLTFFLIHWGMGMFAVFAILFAALCMIALLTTWILRKVVDKYYCQG
ncbi:MAG: hypothetical protein IKE24_02035 [Clostridia bacterium]|nr:hypothetical protein [Clostridia bacterium]